MTNNLPNDLYRCVVQLKSGQRHVLDNYYNESEIEAQTDLLFKGFGYIQVDTYFDDIVKFIKASEIECITWELLKFADTKKR